MSNTIGGALATRAASSRGRPIHAPVPAMSLRNGIVADADARLEHIEALLCSLTGIAMARIQAGPAGEIRQIHLVVSDDTDPPQAVRNAQSALLARLGIHVEARAISTSHTSAATGNGSRHDAASAFPAPAPAAAAQPNAARPPEPTAPAPEPASADLRIHLDSLELERRHSHRLRCRVTITCADQVATGQAEGIDAPGFSLELAARATVDAARVADPGTAGALEIDGLRQIEIAGHEYIMVAARAHLGRTIRYLAGVAAVVDLPEDAAALATLQVIERWLTNRDRPMAHHPK